MVFHTDVDIIPDRIFLFTQNRVFDADNVGTPFELLHDFDFFHHVLGFFIDRLRISSSLLPPSMTLLLSGIDMTLTAVTASVSA